MQLALDGAVVSAAADVHDYDADAPYTVHRSVAAKPRVLLAGFSERNKYFGQFFYATHNKVRNGLIRAGCSVAWFSDRDWAETLAPLGIRMLGKPLANRRFLQLCEMVEPDVLLLMHTDILSPGTIARVRRLLPRVKVASLHLDLVSGADRIERFRRLAGQCDVAFATTSVSGLGDAARGMRVGFVPNPVDTSYETVVSYMADQHDNDLLFAGKARDRQPLLAEVAQLLAHRRCNFHVQAGRGAPLAGARYIGELGRTRIGLNPGPQSHPRWYASDRIAQLFAAGVVVAQPAASGLSEIYGSDALLSYRSAADLARKVDDVLHSGEWRAIARRGRDRAIEISETTLVARYMMDRALGTRSFEWPDWSSDFQG